MNSKHRFHKKRHESKKLQSGTNLARTLSKMGVCSRQQAITHILAGRITVNNKSIHDPGFRTSKGDVIRLSGKVVKKQVPVYVLLNKPAGYVTTREDELGRKTVYELLQDIPEWIFPVGRLDAESEGVLLFTNDTKWGNLLTDPKNEVPRTYRVELDSDLDPKSLEPLRHGVPLGKGETGRVLFAQKTGRNTFRVTVAEGKNREVRRMFEFLGRKVIRLIRTDFGPYALGNMRPGEWRFVRP